VYGLEYVIENYKNHNDYFASNALASQTQTTQTIFCIEQLDQEYLSVLEFEIHNNSFRDIFYNSKTSKPQTPPPKASQV
jgi:hypothetical protein